MNLPAPSARTLLMRSVGRKDTAPELAVRKALHAAGLRFRVNVKGLPGTPDIVLPRRGTVVFVHGCFWHGHCCAHGAVRAKTNTSFWEHKIADNRVRDARKRRALSQLGWVVETVWECQIGRPEVMTRLVQELRSR